MDSLARLTGGSPRREQLRTRWSPRRKACSMAPRSTTEVAKVPMFDDLTDAELQKIVKSGTEVTVPEHWSLIWEKTPADKAYIILDGEVVVRKGKDEVSRLGPGDVVGESAIVNH